MPSHRNTSVICQVLFVRSLLRWQNRRAGFLLHFFERDFAGAEALASEVRVASLELGERWAPAMMDSLIAGLRLWTGQFDAAEELSRRALAEFRDIGDRFGIVQALIPRIRALVALGRTQEAERGLELFVGDGLCQC